MDLKSVALYLAVIAGSGILAWLVFRSETDETRAEEEIALVDRVEDPLWYRHADAERRLEALRFRLPLMTSTAIPPEQAGPTKDEVALLCAFHDDCARVFADHVRAQSRPSAAEISSYMEIFARVRNPHFASLLDLGLNHPAWEVRYNAADAAITQGDPRAVPLLAQALMEQSGVEVLRVIDALVRIGGDEAFGTIAYGLQRTDPEIRKALIVPLARAAYRPALADLRPLLEGENIEVRVLAAWALMAIGQSEGRERLLDFLRDATLPPEVRAQAANLLGAQAVERPDVQAALRELLSEDEPVLTFEARLALAQIGDPEIRAGLLRDLDGELADRRRLAIGILAAGGRDEDIEVLAGRIEGMNLEEFGVFLNAAGRGRAPRALEVIAAHANRADRVGQMALAAFKPFGDEALPVLARLFDEIDDRVLKLEALGAITAIESAAAREVIENLDVSASRELWRAQRIQIRRLDLALARY